MCIKCIWYHLRHEWLRSDSPPWQTLHLPEKFKCFSFIAPSSGPIPCEACREEGIFEEENSILNFAVVSVLSEWSLLSEWWKAFCFHIIPWNSLSQCNEWIRKCEHTYKANGQECQEVQVRFFCFFPVGISRQCSAKRDRWFACKMPKRRLHLVRNIERLWGTYIEEFSLLCLKVCEPKGISIELKTVGFC